MAPTEYFIYTADMPTQPSIILSTFADLTQIEYKLPTTFKPT